tara:strand:- start:561 stop:1172 length:612 start_codon:yes stop_codon:yes gene_type:complete
MSIIRADSIKNRAGNGAPDFPNGITVTGVVTSTSISQSITGNLSVTGNIGIGGTLTYEDVTNVDSIGIITARSGIQIGAGGTIGSSGGGIVTYFGDGSQLSGVDSTALKDGSGNVIVQASASAVSITAGKHVSPASNNSTDLGTSSLRWRDLYVMDLALSNKGKTNDVDGTWGDWTLQEGENDIFMINNRNGKKYKINLTEVE